MKLNPSFPSSRLNNHRSHRFIYRHPTLWPVWPVLLLLGLAVSALTMGQWWAVGSAPRDADRLTSSRESSPAVAPLKSSNTAVGPALGNYPNTTVNLSGATTITPDSPSANTTSINVSSTTNFKGLLTADPATGVVRVTNAYPAGAHPVTVRAFNGSDSVTTTFTLTVPTGTACDHWRLVPSPSFNAGGGLHVINIGDFNNDGWQDVVAASTSSVSLRVGDGLGGFARTTDISTGFDSPQDPVSIAIGDFNNDGNQDFAITKSDRLLILFGDGLGGPGRLVELSALRLTFYHSVAIGDFNNDGNQDIATTYSYGLTVRLGDGLGGFISKPEISFYSGYLDESAAIGDFNGDGKQDIAVTRSTFGVSIFLGDGLGGFGSEIDIKDGAEFLAIGDFNNDGKQDLATGDANTKTVSVRLGDGAGGFGAKPVYLNLNNPVRSLAIGDFNNDGKQDIAAASANTISIWLGDGLGGFGAPTNMTLGSQWSSFVLTIGDLDKDGKQDIVALDVGDFTGVWILTGACSIAAANGLQLQQNSTVNSQIASLDGGGNVSVTVISANPSNGVMISNIVNTDGKITADIAASGCATTAKFTLQASDGISPPSTASLFVGVTPKNKLHYSGQPLIGIGGDLTVRPDPVNDSSTITSYAVQRVEPPLTTAPAVDVNGVVSITNAQPEGFHVITIRMTDCGTTTDAQFTLDVSAVPGVTCLTPIVTANAGSGRGSLSQAILEACDGATITFDMSQIKSRIVTGQLAINKNLTIKGPGASVLTVSGSGGGTHDRIFRIDGGTVNISGLTLWGGMPRSSDSLQQGGAIYNAGKSTISHTTISNNGSIGGGGIYNASTGTLTVSDTSIVQNGASQPGGGISNSGMLTLINSTVNGNYTQQAHESSQAQVGESGAPGAGIFNNGTLTIINSTISNNRTGSGAHAILTAGSGGNGGGIYNTGTLNVTNSTVSGNWTGFGGGVIASSGHIIGKSGKGGSGAGLYNSGTLTITNSTISNNNCGGGGGAGPLLGDGGSGGGLYLSPTAPTTVMANTIVAGNTGRLWYDIDGMLASTSSFNLIGILGSGGLIDGVNHNRVGVANPGLGPLADNGGPTKTHALLPGSPALNAGSNAFITELLFGIQPTDQRGDGFARIVGTSVDIGAFESRGLTLSATSGSAQNAPVNTPFKAPLVATVGSAFGEPVGGAVVTFTAPASGPSGTFPGKVTSVSITTNAAGVATSPTFTANGVGGSPYDVVASIGMGLSTVSFALTNLKGNQTIAFGALPNKTFGASDFTVSATASSGLLISFAASGQCTMSGAMVHIIAPGACTITASQAGDSNFNTAPDVTQSFTIVNGTVIAFSQSNYTVNESDEHLIVTVKRAGDLTIPATVDYATDDTGAPIRCEPVSGNQLASSRCDFGLTLGTLTFAANEAEKTFEIPITQDAYHNGPEMFTVNLSNPTGNATLETPASAVVTINDSTAAAPNAIDDTDAFVCMQYHDFLNREPDPAGLAFWTDNIEKCNDPARRPADLTVAQCIEEMRIHTSAAFFLSIEFQATGNLVRSFYVAALDRPLTNNMPGFVEFERDTQAMQRGVMVGQHGWHQKLDDNRDAFMRDFVTRAEFVGLYPLSDAPWQYVNKLYVHAGIIPGPGDRDAAIAEFGGALTAADAGARGRALLAVTQHPAFQDREMNRSFVQMEYFGYLRRNPNDAPDSDCAGYDFWLNKLNAAGGNYIDAEMVKAFLSSSEYRRRFGP